jgi:hypothetical protein
MAANKGPQYQHVRPITKVRGVVSSLVWVLATQKVLVKQVNRVLVQQVNRVRVKQVDRVLAKQAHLVLYLAA